MKTPVKVSLVRPSIVVPAGNVVTMFTPPLGLAYVAGSLRHAGFMVQLIDGVGESLDTRHPTADDCYYYGLSPEETVARIDPNAGVIGVTLGSSFDWPASRDLAAAIRRRFPRALILGGGEHATAVPHQTLRESVIDIVALGEGEETAVEIVTAYQAGTLNPALIQGIAYKDENGDTIVNSRRPRRRDLDAIPWPAWDLMPLENYLERGFGFGVNRGRSMPLLASRGCPYQCAFCSSPTMWTTQWIARDPDHVLDEMQHYQRAYGIENFDFYDLTAIVKKSWIVSFCRKIEERGMKFTWQLPSGTRSEVIDAEVAALLHRSGCRNMSYAPESGSPAVLERIKKRTRVDAVIDSIAAAHAQGINVKCNIMLGFPGETLREVLETYRFMSRMAWAGAHDVSVWAFAPYPGSELFQEIRQRRRIVLNDAYYNSLRSYADPAKSLSYSEHFGDRQLKILGLVGTSIFYLTSWGRRPHRPLKMMWNLVRGVQESRGEMGLAGIIRRARMSGQPRRILRKIRSVVE